MDPDTPLSAPSSPHDDSSSPSIFRWTLGFLLVGFAWGVTTPFMRRAALQLQREREHELRVQQQRQRQQQREGEAEMASGIQGTKGKGKGKGKEKGKEQQHRNGEISSDGRDGPFNDGYNNNFNDGGRVVDDDDDDDDDEGILPPAPSAASASAQAVAPAPADGQESSATPATGTQTTSRPYNSNPAAAAAASHGASSYAHIIRAKLASILKSVLETLRRPAYAVPLLLNVTGSIWFFLLVGQAGTFFFSFLLFLFISPCGRKGKRGKGGRGHDFGVLWVHIQCIRYEILDCRSSWLFGLIKRARR